MSNIKGRRDMVSSFKFYLCLKRVYIDMLTQWSFLTHGPLGRERPRRAPGSPCSYRIVRGFFKGEGYSRNRIFFVIANKNLILS